MDFERSREKGPVGRGPGAWLLQLDRILRGDATRLSELRRGRIELPTAGVSVVLVVLAMIYGVCMGSFALMSDQGPHAMQVLASMVKMPALYILTVLVTLPSLYVFNALVGSRLTLSSVVRLLIAALGDMLALLASMGPILAFFSASTTSYPFVVLANVVVCAISGLLGLIFLLQTLHRLSLAREILPDAPPVPPSDAESGEVVLTAVEPPGALDRVDDRVLGRHVKTVFGVWVIVFGLVGAQMSWVLRPFIGDPSSPFTWFRPRSSNFFQAVWYTFTNLFG
jgi:hypothetical protein